MNPHLINRREALARVAILLGGIVVGGDAFVRGAAPADSDAMRPGFSREDISLLDDIGDTILPETDTPGARSVNIGAFMAMMAAACYDDAHFAVFKAGLTKIEKHALDRYGMAFGVCSAEQRTAILDGLDAEQRDYQSRKAPSEPAHYFRLLKQLTLLGYFSSETGATQALRWLETPGRYDGAMPYIKGDRAWFNPPTRSV